MSWKYSLEGPRIGESFTALPYPVTSSWSRRATTATNLNEHSSRSHSILIVHVTTSTDDGVPITGKLYLVDLAGSSLPLETYRVI
jgi:hypothetical protein